MPCFWRFPTYVASSAASGLEPVWEELVVCILIARIHFPPVFGRRCSVFSQFPARELVVLGSAQDPGARGCPRPWVSLRGSTQAKSGDGGCPSSRPAPCTAWVDAPSRHLIQAPPGFSPALTPSPPGGAEPLFVRLTPLRTCSVNQIVPLYLWGRGPKRLGLGQGSPPPAFPPWKEPPGLLRVSRVRAVLSPCIRPSLGSLTLRGASWRRSFR